MDQSPQAYRPMGLHCQTRPMAKGKVEWPPLPELPPAFKGATWDFISSSELEQIAETWRQGYPELMGSNLDFIFHPGMYAGRVMLKETWQTDRFERDYCMLRWQRGPDIIGAMMLTKWDNNRQVELTIGTVLPQHRGAEAIFVQGFPLVERWLYDSGAEYLSAFCETWHDLSQRLVEANGFKICGVFPGQLARWAAGDRQYRGCTVHYYKFIKGSENLATSPDEWSLSGRASMLWETIEKLNNGM